MKRRHILQAAVLPYAAALGRSSRAAGSQSPSGNVVVFLSRSGNTRVLAGALARRFTADLFEIRPRDPWPEDYEEMVSWASRMRNRQEPLELAETPDLSGHATVFLGFPIWGMAMPAPVTSFLESNPLDGKSVLPFVTHGGYGAGTAVDSLRELAPRARLAEVLVLRCDQERDTLTSMDSWLDSARGGLLKEN